eukprot:CAMPEP_0174237430 /NCGR_PEP_ID=MMETSP0417-20130205/8342_1 /TAXON_ID=242541 /ORGANISM="Mayorella sp, Strain BSH-02190019" /LENGTH=147 /DNA_ID=CAMNT_0015316183 /DNA_START=51 /DNA_END=490 /DNA_ORIENTATION=-
MRYLLCVDGSDAARKAIQAVERQITPKDELYILHCWNDPLSTLEVVVLSMTGAASSAELREEKAEWERLSRELIDSVAELFVAEKKLPPENIHHVSVQGDPRSVVAEVAEKHNIELIVVGSRGLGRLAGLVIGSVAQAVLATSSCSV